MDRGSQTRLPTRPAVCCAASRTLRASVMTALQVGPGRQPAIWPGPRGLGFMRPGGPEGGSREESAVVFLARQQSPNDFQALRGGRGA